MDTQAHIQLAHYHGQTSHCCIIASASQHTALHHCYIIASTSQHPLHHSLCTAIQPILLYNIQLCLTTYLIIQQTIMPNIFLCTLNLIAIMPPLFLFFFFFHNKKSCCQSYLFNLIRHSQSYSFINVVCGDIFY